MPVLILPDSEGLLSSHSADAGEWCLILEVIFMQIPAYVFILGAIALVILLVIVVLFVMRTRQVNNTCSGAASNGLV